MPPQKIVFKNAKTIVKSPSDRTYTERFELLMKLIRINIMLKNAKIISGEK